MTVSQVIHRRARSDFARRGDSLDRIRAAACIALAGALLALARPAAAALIDPGLGPVVIYETAALVPATYPDGTFPDGSYPVATNGGNLLTYLQGGLYGSYTVVNNTTDLDILGFAVSNPASDLAFTYDGGFGSWNLDATGWSQPNMFEALLSVAYAQATGTPLFPASSTPVVVFGSFASNFGTDTRANLYYSTELTTIIGPGITVSEEFFFRPTQFASSFVAFAIPTGKLGTDPVTLQDIQLIRGTASAVVPLPGAAWLFVAGIAAVGARVRRRPTGR